MKRLCQLGADLNAYKFTFDGSLLDEIRDIYLSSLSNGLSSPQNAFLHEAIAPLDIAITTPTSKFRITSYGKSPLLWISCDDQDSYEMFKRFADNLQIEDDLKQLVDYDRNLVMYCGFYVVGNRLYKENWHVDYFEGSNAYTLITPLFDLDDTHGNLLYKDADGSIKKHRYRLHEAVVFGAGFLHSTECYAKSDHMRVLVSFTIGTDKSRYWKIMKQTIGTQSRFMLLPCGHIKGTCTCQE